MKSDLVGRTVELECLDSLLDGYPALLLRGDLGVGKTALLDAAAARATARGMRVLRAFGAESEAGVSFSTLHQLLYPLRDRIDRSALCQVLDLAPGLSPDPQLVAAVLALLSEVALEQPILMIVDDIGWMDAASASTIGFALRRLGHEPIAILMAARTDAPGLTGLPERVVEPLSTSAADALLKLHWPDLAPAVRRRILADAAGNPLALRELPSMLDEDQRSGRSLLPEFLPLSARLRRRFADRYRTLPSATREVLVQLALEPDVPIRGPAADDLTAAVHAGLVYAGADSHRARFRHPLIRSAIVDQTPPRERRNIHDTLAAVMADSPLRRAWHLASAADGPDESIAQSLETAAAGGPAAGAVTALVRAGELSPRPADRARRLSMAACLAGLTGRLDDVPLLLADASRASDVPAAVDLAAIAQRILYQDGDLDTAYRLVLQALDVLPDEHQWEVDAILHTLLLICLYSGRPEPWEVLNKVISRFEPDAVLPFRLCHDAYVDPCSKADAVRAGLAQALTAPPGDLTPWRLIPLAFAAHAMDVLSDYRCPLQHLIERERDGGATAMVIPALLLLSQDLYAHGQWDDAERLAHKGLGLASEYGYQFWHGQLAALLAVGTALRGDAERTRARCAETTNWAAPRGIGVTEAYARSAGALAAIGQGDFEEALAQIAKVAPSAGVPGRWAVLDLAEAAVRSGHPGQARTHVVAAQRAGLHRISPRIELMITGAAALTVEDEQAGVLFEAALAVPSADRWPFDHARVQLEYGRWLRRTHDTADARVQLRGALETFDRIGAEAFARRAREELRAAGVAYDLPNIRSELTAQERQIAELATTGLTNKQIAERLVLSHRTIASHLHRLYPKLGIASRAGLRAALDAIDPT
ncbi:LuxR C-terminal-related transcriptional regulator [Kribbella sp. NPDC055110]